MNVTTHKRTQANTKNTKNTSNTNTSTSTNTASAQAQAQRQEQRHNLKSNTTNTKSNGNKRAFFVMLLFAIMLYYPKQPTPPRHATPTEGNAHGRKQAPAPAPAMPCPCFSVGADDFSRSPLLATPFNPPISFAPIQLHDFRHPVKLFSMFSAPAHILFTTGAALVQHFNR